MISQNEISTRNPEFHPSKSTRKVLYKMIANIPKKCLTLQDVKYVKRKRVRSNTGSEV